MRTLRLPRSILLPLWTYGPAGFPGDLALSLRKRSYDAATWKSSQRSQLGRMNRHEISSCVRARGETNDPNVSPFKRAGYGIAVGVGARRGGRHDGLDALCPRLAIEHHRESTRRHPVDAIREIWRLTTRHTGK
jgi:hypothetical protein